MRKTLKDLVPGRALPDVGQAFTAPAGDAKLATLVAEYTKWHARTMEMCTNGWIAGAIEAQRNTTAAAIAIAEHLRGKS